MVYGRLPKNDMAAINVAKETYARFCTLPVEPLSGKAAQAIASSYLAGMACAGMNPQATRARPTLVELEYHHQRVDGIGSRSEVASTSMPGLSRAIDFTGTKRRMRPPTNGETFVAGDRAWRRPDRVWAGTEPVAKRLRPTSIRWNNVSAARVMAVTVVPSGV